MNIEIYIHCALIDVQMCIRKREKLSETDFLRVNDILQSNNNLNNTGQKWSFLLNYTSGSRFQIKSTNRNFTMKVKVTSE